MTPSKEAMAAAKEIRANGFCLDDSVAAVIDRHFARREADPDAGKKVAEPERMTVWLDLSPSPTSPLAYTQQELDNAREKPGQQAIPIPLVKVVEKWELDNPAKDVEIASPREREAAQRCCPRHDYLLPDERCTCDEREARP